MLFDVTSLTDTKQRLISKRGLTFRNPLAAYDTVRTDLANNKQRYQTKVSGPYLGNISSWRLLSLGLLPLPLSPSGSKRQLECELWEVEPNT